MPSLAYRRDIDGLRALAILPVVFYHLGLGGITGGYVASMFSWSFPAT